MSLEQSLHRVVARYDELTAVDKKYGLLIGESGVPLSMPGEGRQDAGHTFQPNAQAK